MKKLSILILTTHERKAFLSRLLGELNAQIFEFGLAENNNLIEIRVHGGIESIGFKRNSLLHGSKSEDYISPPCESEYVCFIDDDDMVTQNYISTVLTALENNPDCDCLSLRGIMTIDGEDPEVFEHSIKYNKWETVDGPIKYLRTPNHLNVIKYSIAKKFKFPETNYGEDHSFSKQLHDSGLLKNEVYINQVIYNYLYISKK